MMPRGTICSQYFCKRSWSKWRTDCRGVCALGVARAQADAQQFVMEARFGEAALVNVSKGKAYLIFLGELCQVASEDKMFVFLPPEIVIEVVYMTIEAFLLSGIARCKYCRKRQVFAE